MAETEKAQNDEGIHPRRACRECIQDSKDNRMIHIIKEVAKCLEDAGIAHMFTGSIAMSFYAVPRMIYERYG
jgi:hypothetical protein